MKGENDQDFGLSSTAGCQGFIGSMDSRLPNLKCCITGNFSKHWIHVRKQKRCRIIPMIKGNIRKNCKVTNEYPNLNPNYLLYQVHLRSKCYSFPLTKLLTLPNSQMRPFLKQPCTLFRWGQGCGDLGVCSGGWDSPFEKDGGLDLTSCIGSPTSCELNWKTCLTV